ncbi:MAG: tetratricopeptide repeat protein [Bacteroidia bacterium]
MNWFKLFVISLFCITTGKVFAQKTPIQDLKQKLSVYKRDDTTKLKLLLNISAHYLNQQLDSALKYASASKNLATKLKVNKFELEAYEYLGRAYASKGSLKEALSAFQKEEQIAITHAEKSQTIRNQGNIYIELGKPNEAIAAYLRSLDIAYLSKDGLAIAATLNNIAYVYRQQGKYEEAISYLFKAIKIGEEIKHRSLLGNIYNQLALIQYNRKIYADAQRYATQALNYYNQLDDRQGKATSYTIIGGCYSERNDMANASKYIKEAYNLNVALGDKRQIASSAQNLAEIELKNKNYSEALAYANTAVKGLKEINVVVNLISSYVTRAKISTALKDLKSADEDIKLALALSRSGSFKAQERKGMEALALLKAAEGNHADAFETMIKANVLNDSLLNEVNSKQINELRTKYETEKKQREIEILNQKTRFQDLTIFNKNLEIDKQVLSISNKNLTIAKNESDIKQKSLEAKEQKQKIKSLNQQSTIQKLQLRQRNILLAVSLALFVIGAIVAYLFYNQRKLKAKTQLQEEINKQQDLAAKAVLDAEERERRRIAGDLHDGVGQMLSAALMNLNGLFAKLQLEGEMREKASQSLSLVNDSYDEMRAISHQMMPNALIKSGLASAVKEFLNKIDKDVIKVTLETVGLKERLNEQTETVLYRVIQETVNNVIKHAGANRLDIVIIKDEEGVTATVEDNGIGFDKSKVDLKSGIGISNIYSRVEFLKGTIDIDSAPDKGTLVAIHIPS